MFTYDDYLTQRIKIGKAQYIAFSILSLIEFMDGFQEIFITILVRLLSKEWELQVYQQASLTFSFFFGIMSGNLTSSLLADTVGRKNILIYSQSLAILMMLINSYVIEYYQLIVTIYFYGLVFGVSMPISQVVASEIVPVKIRGRFLVMLQFIYILGILYLILQCYIFLDDLDSGNWRDLLRINILPPILCLLGSIFYLVDSPRLFIMKGEFEEGFNLLDQYGLNNDKSYQPITETERQLITQWQQDLMSGTKKNVVFADLFHDHVLLLTIFILSIFCLYNMVSCGIIVITPFLIGDAGRSFGYMLFTYSMEIPAILFVVSIFDNPQWGGRIKVTIYGLLLMTVGQLLFIYKGYEAIAIVLTCLRFSFRMVWSGLNALPAESYNTPLRSLGVGTAQGTGKVSGALSSIFTLPLFHKSPILPFYFGVVFTITCIGLLLNYPVDQTQKPLDQNREFYNRIGDQEGKAINKTNLRIVSYIIIIIMLLNYKYKYYRYTIQQYTTLSTLENNIQTKFKLKPCERLVFVFQCDQQLKVIENQQDYEKCLKRNLNSSKDENQVLFVKKLENKKNILKQKNNLFYYYYFGQSTLSCCSNSNCRICQGKSTVNLNNMEKQVIDIILYQKIENNLISISKFIKKKEKIICSSMEEFVIYLKSKLFKNKNYQVQYENRLGHLFQEEQEDTQSRTYQIETLVQALMGFFGGNKRPIQEFVFQQLEKNPNTTINQLQNVVLDQNICFM